jgi:HAD superfamily hydrolase (TIGR01459 family)
MTFQILRGIGAIADRYDGYILDVWGVLHNGVEPYPGVVDALGRLRAAGKTVVLLSNAPMRASGVRTRLQGLGIAPSLYGNILTSGEEVWQNLRDRTDPFYAALGTACLWVGPARHGSVVEDLPLPLTLVEDVAAASFILNTGPDDLDEQATRYQPLLAAAAVRGLPMICANADLHVMQGDSVICCAGVLAQRYEDHGGPVRWHGKPFPSVYRGCRRLLDGIDPARILAVGDNFSTDIAGAAGAGLDCALVAGGIHAAELNLDAEGRPDPVRLAALSAGTAQPNWVLPQLIW